MKKHILITLAVILMSVIGCVTPEEGGNDNPQPPTPSQEQITIPSTVDVTPVVPPEGGDAKITFTAASAWTASVISTKADSWVDVNPKSGDPGPAEIKITTTPNDTYVERNATIQIKCGTETKDVVLTQKQVDNITVTTDKVELGAEGGTFTIELKSNIDFIYDIVGDWIKYVSTKAYTDKTLTFTAEPNDGVQKREGSVTVKGGEFSETVKVYQSGEEPTLIITQNAYSLEADGGSITVEVSSNVAVTMTIPENVSWITENKTKSVSTSTFHLDVAANETKEARSAEITFSNEESGLSEKITVNQKGKIYVPVTDMVDLGLSVKWATCNVGASKPEEYGGYYQWAGLEDITSTDIFIGFDENQGIHNCPYHKEGLDYSTGWTKYVQSERFWSGTGSPDHKTVLDPEDDIAYLTLGDKWRMPTDAEWTELRENCTWTWTDDYNGTGIAGRIVTSNMPSYTDKSIFLPAAGYRDDVSLYSDGINGCYWSSSLEPNRSYLAYWVLSYSSNVRRQNCYRFYGNSVRPVYGEKVSVTGVSIYPTSINLDIENTSSLNATVTPFNATEQGISWTSSDTGVATVDQSGKVTAVGAGSATITVTTTDGGYTATCSVTVKSSDPAVPEMVDLGLPSGLKWASFNLGASKPEEYGGYYQWAGIQDVRSTSIYLDWSNCPYHTGANSQSGWTKYISDVYSTYWSGEGSPDNKSVLEPSDDVANVNLGDKWRTPTIEEWNELFNADNCSWTWTTVNGIDGMKVASKKTGFTNNCIFLPAAGIRSYDTADAVGSGYYYSSSTTTYGPFYASGFSFGSRYESEVYSPRCNGLPVRPVYGDKASVTGVSLDPTSLNLNVGETSTLCATVIPSNAADKSVSWTSSDTGIATVDHSGKVTAVKAGSATITVTTTDGGHTATCSVTVKSSDPAVPEMVDLGLPSGLKWASFNLGASKPEEYGGYYQWAGLEDVTSTDIYLDWSNCPYHTGADEKAGWTKYVTSDHLYFWSLPGTPDDNTVLDPEDDIAHMTLGDKWRMPTDAQWTELRENCTWTWTDDYNGTGVAGKIAISNVPGYTDKSIFLPAAGFREEASLLSTGSNGCYWSSTLHEGPNSHIAYYLNLYSTGSKRMSGARFNGLSVRPVYVGNETVKVSGVSLNPTKLSLNIGETATLDATVTPSNATEQGISWTSSDTGIATVDQSGKVTAVGAGSATITVTTTDGGYTATCNVTVKTGSNIEDPEEGDDWEWDNTEKQQ